MKSNCILFSLFVIIVSCNNTKDNRKQLTQQQKDSIQLDSMINAENLKYPPPKGFLGLDWYISIEEAMISLKKRDSVKIKSTNTSDLLGDWIVLKGFFSGYKIKEIELNFYTDKFCQGNVNFGLQTSDF